MQRKMVTIDEIYDLFAIRIVFKPIAFVPEKTQCWNIYSLITDIYKPKPDRIRGLGQASPRPTVTKRFIAPLWGLTECGPRCR